MPYIKKHARKLYDSDIESLLFKLEAQYRENGSEPSTLIDGDVNYIITRIVAGIYAKGGYSCQSRGHECFNAAMQEYYRRVMVPHEILKIQENGDAY